MGVEGGNLVVADEFDAGLDGGEDGGGELVGKFGLAVGVGHDVEVGEEVLQLVKFR